MITLARQIGETAHCSLLQRKARRHGLADLTSIMRLAVARGARHYASVYPPAERDPGVEAISHEELVALLLLGAQPFEPFALRCAAQIISLCDPDRLSVIARRERISRPLAHIAHAGAAHDSEQTARWQELLRLLGSPPPVPSGRLPHWSRFVSHSGLTRSGPPSHRLVACLPVNNPERILQALQTCPIQSAISGLPETKSRRRSAGG